MTVNYLLTWSDFKSRGVLRKALEQVGAWTSLGVTVKFALVTRAPEQAAAFTDDVSKIVSAENVFTHTYSSGLDRNRATRKALDTLNPGTGDVLYMRHDLYLPAVGHAAAGTNLVLEMNTDDIGELRLTKSKFSLYNRLTRNNYLRQADGIVFVTNELAASRSFSKFKGHRTVIGNGIDLTRYPIIDAPDNEQPRLVFIGSPGLSWHGMDKLFALAEACPEWSFDVIGTAPDALSDRPSNIKFHGALERGEYESLMLRADIGVGSLALFRIGMNEACPLKVREYLAFGKPVIIGYKDTDLSLPAKWLMQVPNVDNGVSDQIDEIREFVNLNKGAAVPREEIEHLDVMHKERARLDFFRSVVKQHAQY